MKSTHGKSLVLFSALLLSASLLGGCGGGDDDPCQDVDCGAHGSCDADSGACVCDTGYSGAACTECAVGYHAEGDACVADECAADGDCDDGQACNGAESCVGGSCQAGTPVDCGDNASCQEPDGDCVCDPGFYPEGDGCVAGLEIIGAWVDDWGTSHDIAQDSWTMGDDLFHISQLDNQADYLVAQNDAANAYNPELWSRFDWTWHEGELYYCQIAYDAADEASAAGNEDADRADLDAGCAGFSWSRLSERLEIIGAWVDDWGTSHDIAQDSWTMGDDLFHISQLDNQADYLVAQNDAANAYNPELWSRFDWTWHEGELYYCQIAYDAADEASAAGNEDADRADLDAGCAGFSWSRLTPS